MPTCPQQCASYGLIEWVLSVHMECCNLHISTVPCDQTDGTTPPSSWPCVCDGGASCTTYQLCSTGGTCANPTGVKEFRQLPMFVDCKHTQPTTVQGRDHPWWLIHTGSTALCGVPYHAPVGCFLHICCACLADIMSTTPSSVRCWDHN